MTRAQTEDAVREVVDLALGTRTGPGEDVQRAQAAEWDSLKHVAILFGVEDACAVRFEPDELDQLASLSAIVDAVERHRTAAGAAGAAGAVGTAGAAPA